MWKGSISFGLVNIPVQLYTATEEKSVRFTLLHRACHTPVRYVKYCPACNLQLSQDDVVRGFAYDPDRYILIEDADLEQLPLPTVRTVDIVHFVHLNEIDPLYFSKTYYIEPQERADKAYALLLRALAETGRIAVAKIALRQKESLAAVRPAGNFLLLHLMHFPDEVRPTDGLRGGSQAKEPTELEMRMAKQLVESLATAFNPAAYRDEYREALLQRIEEKARGETGVVRPDRPADARVDDLLAALEASLQAAQQAQPLLSGTREPLAKR